MNQDCEFTESKIDRISVSRLRSTPDIQITLQTLKSSLNPQLKIIIAILDKIILFEPIKWFLFKKNFSKKHFFTFL